MATMRVAEVAEPGTRFELVDRDLPEPAAGQVRVTVEACGICHSDAVLANGWLPGTTFPVVPGHEIAGRVAAVGAGVNHWQVGQRVGVGWFGGACGHCPRCRGGDAITCPSLQIPGLAYPGGFADAVVVPADALAAIPDELTAVEAAPLMCAGVTTYNALRHSVAAPGDTVAILGLGGLGHLGVQYAAKLGFRTVAIARGAHKEQFARDLGAHHYIDSTAQDVAAALTSLGGARVVLATVTAADAMSAAAGGLSARGQLVIVGASTEPLQITPLQLIFGSQSVVGHASGTARDSEETLAFSVLTGVRAMTETVPLPEVSTGFDRMLSGEARFRAVLTTGN
ncbi:MAG TPA: alcohol dehydrogenase catalytic domain-containing protein [Micromonosporaceae bacterium]|nr:alcohol dehydrogenase catalytic domain-containing protein [Micromonosporaceae bacterium]